MINSVALPIPTILGSRWVPPQPGISPNFTSGCANIAFFQNEIFNLPYSIELFNDKKENIYYSKFNQKFYGLFFLF